MIFTAQQHRSPGTPSGFVARQYNIDYAGATNLQSQIYEVLNQTGLLVTLERILDLLEADETFDASSGKARKLLRGTDVVLLEKDVNGTSLLASVELVD